MSNPFFSGITSGISAKFLRSDEISWANDNDNYSSQGSIANNVSNISQGSIIREMSADVISKIRQKGSIYPAELRSLLHMVGIDDPIMTKHNLYRPRAKINDCGLDQNCIERFLTTYMS